MSKAGKKLIAAAKETRRAIRAGELDEKIVGFFAQLTPEQQKAALEYRGEDC